MLRGESDFSGGFDGKIVYFFVLKLNKCIVQIINAIKLIDCTLTQASKLMTLVLTVCMRLQLKYAKN